MKKPQASPNAILLTQQEFWTQFKPLKNQFSNEAAYMGCMFKKTGEEMDFVLQQAKKNPSTIWTVVVNDGDSFIGEGFHHASGIGYIVTEVPALRNQEYIVRDKNSQFIPEASIQTIASIDMTEVISYEDPAEVTEWKWIEENASFKHIQNAESGIWEFMLNTSLAYKNVPARLQGILKEARAKDVSYLIFHQGT